VPTLSAADELILARRWTAPLLCLDLQLDETTTLHLADHYIARSVAPMIEPQFAAKRLGYVTRVTPDVLVRTDRDKLQQILINLLSNAVKFTPSGGTVTIDLGTRAGAPAGFALLRVSDTGIGIPREKQETVFDPFIQVHRRLTSSTEGTGLGLAISRDLARGMGGELRVRSVEGKGSTFTLALPLAN